MAPARPRSPRRCSSPPGRSPAWARSRTARRSATSTPRSSAAASRCRSRWRRSSSTATRSTCSTRPATPTSSATSPPRSRPPTSRCSSCRRSRASRCRPRSRGSSPRRAGSRARSSSTSSTASARRSRARSTSSRNVRCRRRAVAAARSARRPRSAASSSCSTTTRSRTPTAHRRAPRARSRPRWRSRSTRSTTRSSRASSSATTTSWSATSATRRSTSPSSRARSPTGIATGTRVPGAVRQRDQARRHRPARDVPRRGGPGADRRATARPAAVVFKTIVDPYVGHVNLFKVLQGTVKHDDVLANGRTVRRRARAPAVHDARQGAGHRHRGRGGRHRRGRQARRHEHRRRARRARARRSTSSRSSRPQPVLAVAIKARSKGDEDKLANALHRLQEEDLVLRIERNPETHQTVLRGMGETHLSIALEKLRAQVRRRGRHRRRAGRVPRDDHRQRPRPRASYKKQTGGHGQFAVAWLRVEPQERGAGNEFVDAIVGGVIPQELHPRGREGRRRGRGARRRARLPGRRREDHLLRRQAPPGRQLRDGFKMAGVDGPARTRSRKASPILLEPVSELVVTVPEANQGDIMGDLNGKRGRIQGSASVGDGEVEIVAIVPTSEILRYAIDLRSMTGGRGRFSTRRTRTTTRCPSHLVDKIVVVDEGDREGALGAGTGARRSGLTPARDATTACCRTATSPRGWARCTRRARAVDRVELDEAADARAARRRCTPGCATPDG